MLLALRTFRRTPAITAIALGSIAVTVGATAVVFTAVKTVLLDPLPYARQSELVQFRTDYSRFHASQADWVMLPDMQDVMRRNHSFESIGTYHYALYNLTGDGNAPPEALYGLAISANMFATLGVKPMLGRDVLPEETQFGRDHEMILSYGLWTRRFNADPKVVGRSVEVNGHSCTIIGVMPPGFDFPMRLATTVRTPSGHMDFWAPDGMDPAKISRQSPAFGAVGRLRPGISQVQAEQDVLSISTALEREYPRTNQGRSLHLISLRNRTLGFARTGLPLLLAAALMFLLIGCANVANLLLARTFSRQREIAVRMALGARRSSIVRQLVSESFLLGVAGGIAGYALTVLAWKLLPAVAPVSIPRLATARPDWAVFAFTLAVSAINALIFGLAPALGSARGDPALALREAGTRGSIGTARNRLRSALVVGEVAVAVTLVIIGGLLTGSFVKLIRTSPGFDSDHVLASIIITAGDQYRTPGSQGILFRHIVDSVHALPGVESVATVDALPFSGENNGGTIRTDLSAPEQQAEVDRVSADYLQTMGVQLLQGRWLREEDMAADRDTAIVNDVAASKLWPGQDALGKRFCLCWDVNAPVWKRVVGVVQTMRHSGLDEPIGAAVYFASSALDHAQFLVVRTARPSDELAKSVRMAVASVDPKQPVFLSASMSRLIGDSIADRRFIMTLLAITGCLALLLAAAGVYGVISYATSRRTQEIGVRMALGATPRNVQLLIFRHGMLLAGAGVVIGLSLALAAIRIFSLASADAALVALAVALVVVTAAVACFIPARRATHIDPMLALRQD
ncbi:MAG TPA: ABC transporter permease [Bryobacteraceae bacterium]|nr:ABC transporter permease [Bryobacteraceae bacterium]